MHRPKPSVPSRCDMNLALVAGLSALIGIGFLAHLISCAAVVWRFLRAKRIRPPAPMPALTVLRPVCGIDPGLEETLASSYRAHDVTYEVLFCVANADDPSIPLIRRLIAAHPETPARLLIGDERVSSNPKLNNLVKGWNAARHDWIAMIDSNVLLPRDYVQELFSAWQEDTGLVTSPPEGIRPKGLWAKLECALLNGYQARWQLAGDQLCNGFAQGKVLFWRRDILDDAGGPAALGRELAEDVAATKIVRRGGLRVRLITSPFPQPIYHRTFREVWLRHVRWARVRRAGFPSLFALEVLTGSLVPVLATVSLVALHHVPVLAIPAMVALWYGLEWVVAASAGWSASAKEVPVWILRDASIPVIWLAAFASRGFVWRSTRVEPDHEPIVAAE